MTAASAARPARPWSLHRKAAKAVVLNARDTDDARLLLDMLGLVDGPEGREITPDDGRAIDLELLRLCPGERPPDDLPKLMSLQEKTQPDLVPPGLRTPSPAALSSRRPALPPIEHGTTAGYRQHHERGALPACDDCQLAHDIDTDIPTEETPAMAQPAAAPPPTAEPASPEEQLVTAGVLDPAADETMPIVGSAYIAVLQARELFVDRSYQRSLDEPRVRRMAKAWDPRMLGTLDVSDRGPAHSPRYAIVDGQQRHAGAVRVSHAGDQVWLACNVHEGLTVADEARLMHELDRTKKKLSGWDRWHARRGAGDPAVLKVEEIAARHGLRVSNDAATPGSMRSYGAAEKLLGRGGEQLLHNALAVLRAAWEDNPSAYQAPLLTGVGHLLHVYGSTVDIDRLSRALAGARPEQLRATATALRDIDGGPLHELMTRAIAGQYNRTPGNGPRLGGRA